jgi:hypothetical protein
MKLHDRLLCFSVCNPLSQWLALLQRLLAVLLHQWIHLVVAVATSVLVKPLLPAWMALVALLPVLLLQWGQCNDRREALAF